MEPSNDSNPLRDVGQSIDDALTDLEARVEAAMDDGLCPIDPDVTLEGLEASAAALCDSLSELDAELENASRATACDLHAVTTAVVERQTDAIAYPVIVRTQIERGRAEVPVTAEALTSIVAQIVKLSLAFAGAGGEISLRSESAAGTARLAIEAIRSEPIDSDPALSFASAIGFAEDLGGSLDVENVDEQIRIDLSFATSSVDGC